MHQLTLLMYGVPRSRAPFGLTIAMPKLDLEDGI
jgi:hypothetical protein